MFNKSGPVKSKEDSSPSFIAREALKQLAILKIPPTPDNYHKVYEQIAGNRSNQMSPPTVKILIELTKEFPRHKPDLLKLTNSLEQAINNKNWSKYKSILTTFVANDIEPIAKSDRQNHRPIDVNSDQDHATNYFAQQLLELLAQILEHIASFQIEDEALIEEARTLAQQVRKIRDKSEMTQFITSFQAFCIKFEVHGEDGIKLQQGLLRLLNLLMDSTGELLSEDQWVRKQIFSLKSTMSRPLNMEIITKAEHHLKKIIQRQKTINNSLGEARITLKKMMSSLIDNLEVLSGTTGEYQNKLECFSKKINQTNEIEEINQLIVEIMQETELARGKIINSQNELQAARTEASMAQDQINQLEIKLVEMDNIANEDHLTGALNRRGLDNAFEREISRASRSKEPFCFALLDIDNFKQLNDTHGHHVGDLALIYLTDAIKESTRPEDTVSRFGGEEFAILLPSIEINKGLEITKRILRNLTKKFFLHENKRILITFSAGVAQGNPEESQKSILERADGALYRAKKNGKNQILQAEESNELI